MAVIYLKNMVCDRCKEILERDFQDSRIPIDSIKLGEIIVEKLDKKTLDQIKQIIEKNGFELVQDETELLVERIKGLLITKLNGKTIQDEKMSEFLSRKLNKEYSLLSKQFSRNEGHTIEKHFIYLKIEKAKELIQTSEMHFSEIAYILNYSNSGYLAKQFKSVTGMTMGEYGKLQNWNRKSLDKII